MPSLLYETGGRERRVVGYEYKVLSYKLENTKINQLRAAKTAEVKIMNIIKILIKMQEACSVHCRTSIFNHSGSDIISLRWEWRKKGFQIEISSCEFTEEKINLLMENAKQKISAILKSEITKPPRRMSGVNHV